MFLSRAMIMVFVMALTAQCKEHVKKTTPTGQNTGIMQEKFNWLPSECAPEHYHASIYEGDLITEDNRYYGIPKGGTIQNGWGRSGSTWIVGPEMKAVPVRLKIIWISYTEDQFYYGDFELPKQKMTDLFRKGYTNTRNNTNETYTKIQVGLAPGGAVSVWLLGAGNTVEVGHYQAKKTEVAMADFKPNAVISLEEYIKSRKKEFSDQTKRVIARDGVPIGKWTKYTKRYLWKPAIGHEDGFTLDMYYSDFYNGEVDGALAGSWAFTDLKEYAVPKKTFFRFLNNKGIEFGCQVYFDEAEIWKAFETIYADPKTKNATLHYNVKPYNNGVSIFLASENDTVRIKKARAKIYASSL